MRRHDLTQKTCAAMNAHNCGTKNPGDLWHLRHWLQFWQLRTWIHENLCYLTIKSDSGQHSQYCNVFGSGHVFSSLWTNVSKVTKLLFKLKYQHWWDRYFDDFHIQSMYLLNENIARIANAVHCHSWLSGNKDFHEFRFSIVRIVISVSIVTSLQDCLVSQGR